MNRDEIRQYFERVAPVWDAWRRRNAFYHAQVLQLVQGMVPPGAQVLELGTGTGDLLAALRPARGVGLTVAQGLTDRAARKYPHLEFRTVAVDTVWVPEGFQPEYVILSNLLDYVYDVWALLDRLK